MNPVLTILALLFLIPIYKDLKDYVLFKWYSKRVIAHITNDIIIKETFTKYIVSILQGGNSRATKVSYKFIFNNKEHQVINENLAFAPKSKFNKLKKGNKIDVYVYSKSQKVKNTWLIKPNFMGTVFLIILFIMTLIVAYASAGM